MVDIGSKIIIPDLVVTKNVQVAIWVGIKLSNILHDFGSYQLRKDWLRWFPTDVTGTLILPDIRVTPSATEKSLTGKHVYGNLPLHLAAHCKTFTEVVFPHADRKYNKQTLTLNQLNSSNAYLKTFIVDEVTNNVNDRNLKTPFSVIRHQITPGDVFTVLDRSVLNSSWMVMVVCDINCREVNENFHTDDDADKTVIVVPIVANTTIDPKYECTIQLLNKPHNVKCLSWCDIDIGCLRKFSYVSSANSECLDVVRDKVERIIIDDSFEREVPQSDIYDKFTRFIDNISKYQGPDDNAFHKRLQEQKKSVPY